MPVKYSEFKPAFLLGNPHLQTIIPAKLRLFKKLAYKRTRLELADGDFLDLDCLQGSGNKTVILSHGLEGSSNRPYLLGLSNSFHKAGYSVIAWNFRGCSGEPNRIEPWYHSGMSKDLKAVVAWALANSKDELYLLGCSIGGNITLKYLGEESKNISERIKAAAVISVPCDLENCAMELAKKSTRIYMNYFLRSLKKRLIAKAKMFPKSYTLSDWHKIKNFQQLDNRYTAPMHGYRNAQEYWRANSCKYFLSTIAIPTLILNSQDDPFLGAACHPVQEAQNNDFLTLELTNRGGHMGFMPQLGRHYAETRSLNFFNK